MSYPPEIDSKMSYADMEDYEYSHYRDLKRRKVEVQISRSRYICPYCYGKRKREYDFEELFQHSSRNANDPDCQSLKEKAKHLALLKYMERHLGNSKGRDGSSSMRYQIESSRKVDCPSRQCQTETASENGHLGSKGSKKTLIIDRKSGPGSMDEIGRKQASSKVQHSEIKDDDQEFVWPWKGIIANIKTERKDGQRVAESGTNLRNDLASKGFNPLRVHNLWSRSGHSGFALVEFGTDWTGLSNAMKFESYFAQAHQGKEDYYKSGKFGDKLFGWVARDDDYYSNLIFGVHLRKTGDLKSVTSKQAEEEHRTTLLVSDLANTLEVKNKLKEKMEYKLSKTMKTLNMRLKEKDEMVKHHNEEYERITKSEEYRFQKICQEHERATVHLEKKRKELEEREKQLKLRQDHSEVESRKIHQEKIKNEKASIEQKKADESMYRLAEEQKQEKEKLRKRIIELEKKLDAKQELELEIERMRGAIKVMNCMDAEDAEVKKRVDKIKEELKEKEEDLEDLETLNQALIVKERKSNDELQEARKELMDGVEQLTTRAFIGVKRMGELNIKPFVEASRKKFSDQEADSKAMELCSQWDNYLREPSWHPFKIITVDGKTKEIVDEQDEKLKYLKEEYGDEVFKSVTTALMEINAYNPSGRYIIKELWNFREGKKSSLREGAEFLLTLWKRQKSRKP